MARPHLRITRVDEQQLWTCSICGDVDVWGPGWEWYGSLKFFDQFARPELVTCSTECRAAGPHPTAPKVD